MFTIFIKRLKFWRKVKTALSFMVSGILQYKDADMVAMILNLAALIKSNKPKVISLKRYGNSRGAWDIGLATPRVRLLLS